MRISHSLGSMNPDHLRTFFFVLEAGSLNKAAEQLHVSQSTLTRHIQALEHVVGGKLLERTSSGVVPTATGEELRAGMRPVLDRFDQVLRQVRGFARGERELLRIGYLGSAAATYLNPVLATFRSAHPEVRIRLLDLSPGEQINALRENQIDVALIGHAGAYLTREFYTRRLASTGVLVALSDDNRLVKKESLRIENLQEERFVGAATMDMPGHNQWVTQLCRRAGFRPHFVIDSDSLAHGFASVVSEEAVMLVPDYLSTTTIPGITFRPLNDPAISWKIYVAWQRGKVAGPLIYLLDTLTNSARGR